MGWRQLYTFLLLACVVGYVWIALVVKEYVGAVCFFRRLTTIPCPSCGATTSIIALYNGDFVASLQNPLAYVIIVFFLVTPMAVLLDVCMKQKNVFYAYNYVERMLKTPKYMKATIVFVGLNWLWIIFQNV